MIESSHILRSCTGNYYIYRELNIEHMFAKFTLAPLHPNEGIIKPKYCLHRGSLCAHRTDSNSRFLEVSVFYRLSDR